MVKSNHHERYKHMKKIMFGLLSIFFIFILSACSTKIYEGKVFDKEDKESYTTTYMQCMAYTAQGTCSSMMPATIYYPEKWTISISGQDKEGNQVQESYEVSESQFKSIQDGDYVKFDKYGKYQGKIK